MSRNDQKCQEMAKKVQKYPKCNCVIYGWPVRKRSKLKYLDMRHRAEGSELELGNAHTPNPDPSKIISYLCYFLFWGNWLIPKGIGKPNYGNRDFFSH